MNSNVPRRSFRRFGIWTGFSGAIGQQSGGFGVFQKLHAAGRGNPAADIKKVTVKKASGNCKVNGLKFTPNGTTSVCGAFTGIVVKELSLTGTPSKIADIANWLVHTRPQRRGCQYLHF